ncbi:reverse transcriptase domain-containing protein [Tanacetum coccineum]
MGGTLTLRNIKIIPIECAMISGPEDQPPPVNKVKEERIKVAINPEHPEHTVMIGSDLTEKTRSKLCNLLQRSLDIFAWTPTDMTGVPRQIAEHKLNVRKGCQPVRQKKRGQAAERNVAINDEVSKLVTAGIMREVHYHDWLNQTLMDGYPLPEIDWKVESLCGFPFKCFLDAYKGYHQIQMAEEDEEKTAFITNQGIFCYTKMPFGLRNAGATYQRLVDKTFHGQIGRNLEVYVDDLVIKSRTEDEVVRDIEETFKTLRKINMKLNPKKCTFGVEEGMFLGYQVNTKGIKICPDKVLSKVSGEIITIFQNFEKMHKEKKKKSDFYGQGTNAAFKQMKEAIAKFNLCSQHQQNKRTQFYMAASKGSDAKSGAYNLGFWYTLRPRVSVKGQILADFIVERPEEEGQDDSAKEEEPLPARWTLFTDGSSCVDGCGAGVILTDPEGVEFTYALRFQFETTNNEAEYEALIAGLRMAEKMGVKNLEVSVDSKLVANQVNGTCIAKETDMIKYLEKVNALTRPSQANYVLREIHEGSCSMHAGTRSVVAKALRTGYYWPTMHKDARALIKACQECQVHKPVPRNPQEKLNPITSPWPFYKWGIDIAGPFPEGPGKVKFLIVAMNYFYQWIKPKPVATITGNQVKKFVWENIVCRFGLPGEIISDNGKQFRDNPFKDWCEKLCIQQHFASVKHPQTNGLVERANRSLGEGIKARLGKDNKNWLEEISHVLWAHRTMIKSSNGDTPLSLTYGTKAVIPAEIGMPTFRTAELNVTENDEALEINLELLEEKREQAAIREAKSKRQMEKYYNNKVRNASFKPGDLVYRSNEASHVEDTGKLGPKWEGPYEVTEALGKGSYKLKDRDGRELPRTWNGRITGAFILMNADEIRLLLKEQVTTNQQQADALHAQLVALQLELQATKTLLQTRQGGGGDAGSLLPRSMRLDVSKFLGRGMVSLDDAKWLDYKWDTFLDSVKNRFGPSKYEDPRGALSKLLQTRTVAQYQSEFEKLVNRVTDIFENLLISFYVSGLKPNLPQELLVAKPTNLGDAFALARVTEARLDDQRVSVVGQATTVLSRGVFDLLFGVALH